MFARVSTIQGSPEHVEEGIRRLEQSRSAIEGLDGFKGAYLLADRTAGTIMTITFWESEQAMHASSTVATRERGQAAEAAGQDSPRSLGTKSSSPSVPPRKGSLRPCHPLCSMLHNGPMRTSCPG
jgi:heme-degrading monooxygenase HmoA